jgi:hypothetical protein
VLRPDEPLDKDKLATAPASLLGGAGGTAAQAISLADAQALISTGDVAAGAFYEVSSAIWNGATPATVYVFGETASTYAPTGWALDANDVRQEVKVNIPAGTYDTKPLRDLQLFQAGDVNAQGEVVLWLGEATTGAGQIKEVLL